MVSGPCDVEKWKLNTLSEESLVKSVLKEIQVGASHSLACDISDLAVRMQAQLTAAQIQQQDQQQKASGDWFRSDRQTSFH